MILEDGLELGGRVMQAVTPWVMRYPVMRAIRLKPVTAMLAAAAPFCSIDVLACHTRLCFCIFAIDDILDEQHLPEHGLQAVAARCSAVVRGESRLALDDEGGVALAFQEVRRELEGYPLFGALGEAWADAMCGTIEAMLDEHSRQLRYPREGAAAFPSYAEYLETGFRSIAAPPYVLAALITLGDSSALQHLERLRAMTRLCAIAIRLANDLRTHAKEKREGKINSITILAEEHRRAGAPAALAETMATARVREDITRCLAELSDLGADRRTESGRPESVITRLAQVNCDFYARDDYHTFVREKDAST